MRAAGAESFADAVKMATETYRVLERKIIDAKQIRGPLPISDDGAFAPDLENDEAALAFLDASIRDAGYEDRIKIALDVTASAFYKEGFTIYSKYLFPSIHKIIISMKKVCVYIYIGRYDLAFKTKDSDPSNYLEAEALRDLYLKYLSKFPALVSIEDPFDQEHWEDWLTIVHQGIQVVSDELTAMNIKRIEEAMNRNVANCLILKISQIGTVTEVINCAKMAKINNWGYIVSASYGETEDNFIADLAVGLSAGQFKAGAPCR